MRTRREILAAAIAVTTGSRSILAKASQPQTAVHFDIPQHACDCHTHIYGERNQFPLSPGRVYTPEAALPAEMAALHRALHIERVVIVTPSVYGADNSATLYGMKARGQNARGIAVIDGGISDSDLQRMADAGIRGVRINSATAGINDPAIVRRRLQTTTERVKKCNWHIQMYTSLAVISAIKDLVKDSPVPVVFDHLGGAQAGLGSEQTGFDDLLRLVRSGRAFVKVSGAYLTSHAPDYADVTPLARALIAASPDHILWGSDWPHPNSSSKRPVTDVIPFHQIDDGRLLNQLAIWEPNPATRRKILVENPARLYGF